MPFNSRQNLRVNTVAYAPNGMVIATGDSEHKVKLWEARSGSPLRTLIGHCDEILNLEFSPDSQHLLSTSANWSIRLWDVETGSELKIWQDEEAYTCWATFSPDGNFVLIGGLNGKAFLREIQSDQVKATFIIKENAEIHVVDFAHDQQHILTGDGWGKVCIWDVQSGRLVKTLGHYRNGNGMSVSSACFSPDGKHILTCDSAVHVWNMATGVQLREHITPDGFNMAVFSPDGRYIAVGCPLGQVPLWEAGTGQLVHEFIGHSNNVYAIAFSQDCQYILTGSDDGTARLWDVQTAVEIYRLQC